MTTTISVDVEADGPIPGGYSMLAIGAIVVEPALDRTFYVTLQPISDNWKEDALAVTGFTRKQTLGFPSPKWAMQMFAEWLGDFDRPLKFVSDNNGFDWSFVNWYFHTFLSVNPFGHSSTNLGSLYKGMKKDVRANFKHLRRTKHTHNALDDAKGNAEALLAMIDMGLHIP